MNQDLISQIEELTLFIDSMDESVNKYLLRDRRAELRVELNRVLSRMKKEYSITQVHLTAHTSEVDGPGLDFYSEDGKWREVTDSTPCGVKVNVACALTDAQTLISKVARTEDIVRLVVKHAPHMLSLMKDYYESIKELHEGAIHDMAVNGIKASYPDAESLSTSKFVLLRTEAVDDSVTVDYAGMLVPEESDGLSVPLISDPEYVSGRLINTQPSSSDE